MDANEENDKTCKTSDEKDQERVEGSQQASEETLIQYLHKRAQAVIEGIQMKREHGARFQHEFRLKNSNFNAQLAEQICNSLDTMYERNSQTIKTKLDLIYAELNEAEALECRIEEFRQKFDLVSEKINRYC
jgi:hypothetical protein